MKMMAMVMIMSDEDRDFCEDDYDDEVMKCQLNADRIATNCW